MKKLINLLFFVGLITIFNASSCNKPDEPELPTGENTMYYYLDGKLHIPKGNYSVPPFVPAIYYYFCTDQTSFSFTGRPLEIFFYEGIQNIGKIILNQSNYDSCYVGDNHAYFVTSELWNDGIYHTTWYYTHDGSGEINITYLSDNKRHFKGTFEMTVYHENTGVEKHITGGHFNINLDTLDD